MCMILFTWCVPEFCDLYVPTPHNYVVVYVLIGYEMPFVKYVVYYIIILSQICEYK